MSRQKQIILAILVIVLAGAVFWGFRKPQIVDNSQNPDSQSVPAITANTFPPTDYATTTLKVGSQVITVAIADNENKQEVGLGGLDSMPEDSGMLFSFSNSDYRDFWMKDMKFQLDIIWLDENAVITHISKNLSPDTYPKIFSSPKPSLYVLEVNAGFTDKYGIKIGDRVKFTGEF